MTPLESPPSPGPVTRATRRRTRTRAALVGAARRLLADGRSSVSIQEITELADVATGSFYNHFDSKEQLFEEAVIEALRQHGELLDALTADLDDPAEVFARSWRLTARLPGLAPEVAKVVFNAGPAVLGHAEGMGPRAFRDIRAASAAGRFRCDDVGLAVISVGGVLLALLGLLLADPDRDVDEAADRAAVHVLLMLGMSRRSAEALCRRDLPLEAVQQALHGH